MQHQVALERVERPLTKSTSTALRTRSPSTRYRSHGRGGGGTRPITRASASGPHLLEHELRRERDDTTVSTPKGPREPSSAIRTITYREVHVM